MTTSPVDPLRLRAGNDRPLRPRGRFVLYWMTRARRLGWSRALDRAVALARELRRPLVILEALRFRRKTAALQTLAYDEYVARRPVRLR